MALSELWVPETPPVGFRIFCPVDLLTLQGVGRGKALDKQGGEAQAGEEVVDQLLHKEFLCEPCIMRWPTQASPAVRSDLEVLRESCAVLVV